MGKIPSKLPKNPRIIEINAEKHKQIGSGCFGRVYRLTPRKVVKVFYSKIPKYVISSEIKGSKASEHALPVLKVVKVKIKEKEGKEYWGLIKRYIPFECNYKEADKVKDLLMKEDTDDTNFLACDCHTGNIRKDSNGKLWLIDTQLEIPQRFV